MDLIRTEQLTRRFNTLAAVDGVSFQVEEGEIFGLVGPDGAGKTTLLRMLAGILDLTAGDAWVAGHHVAKEEEALKNVTGYMSQRFGLYPDLTVAENLEFYSAIYHVPRKQKAAHIANLLEVSRLEPFRRRLAGHLSGGMKQKLALTCALIHTPRVLLLDEPTNGVDPVSRRDFWRILYHLALQGVTILVSTAYLDEAERCNRVGLMHHGKLIAAGTPREVKRVMRDSVVEVRASHPRRTVAVLRERLPGHPVHLFGDRVHIATPDPGGVTARLAGWLEAAGLHLESAEVVPPALEDIFVSVLEQKEGGRESDV